MFKVWSFAYNFTDEKNVLTISFSYLTRLEQKSTAITAKKEARSAGNRLTLRKRQYSPHTDLKDCFMNF